MNETDEDIFYLGNWGLILAIFLCTWPFPLLQRSCLKHFCRCAVFQHTVRIPCTRSVSVTWRQSMYFYGVNNGLKQKGIHTYPPPASKLQAHTDLSTGWKTFSCYKQHLSPITTLLTSNGHFFKRSSCSPYFLAPGT